MVGSGSHGLRVALLAPMEMELRPVARALSLEEAGPGLAYTHRREVGGVEIVAARTNIGTAPAAAATERILDDAPCALVVVVGIAGGLRPGIEIGEVVVPELVIDGGTGHEFEPAPLAPLVAAGKLFTSDELKLGGDALGQLVDAGIVAVDMETSAVAAVCHRRGQPWSVVRAISDRPSDGLLNEGMAALGNPDGTADREAVERYLAAHPEAAAAMARLAEDSRLAARNAAQAAAEAVTRFCNAPTRRTT